MQNIPILIKFSSDCQNLGSLKSKKAAEEKHPSAAVKSLKTMFEDEDNFVKPATENADLAKEKVCCNPVMASVTILILPCVEDPERTSKPPYTSLCASSPPALRFISRE